MTTTNSNTVVKGTEVKTYLDKKDDQLKSMRSTTSSVAEGDLVFPKKPEDWEISIAEWVGRDGKTRDYPCVVCKDSKGDRQEIALSAFRAKDEILTLDGTTIQCSNLCEFDADYNTIWNTLQSAKKITLYRVVGRRNNRKGRYEFFTYE